MGNGIIFKLKLIFVPCVENNYRPKFLESRVLSYYLIALLLLKLVIVPVLVYFPKTVFFADITKAALVSLTNSEREALGVQPLKENSELDRAALLKAQDILANDYFSHYSPTGTSPWYWFGQAGYNYDFAGENLAIGFLDSEEVSQAWMLSPSHRANVLSSNYEEIGIAVVKGEFQGGETTVVVQLFGSPKTVRAPVKAPETVTEAPAETEEIALEPAAAEEEVLPAETVSPAEAAEPTSSPEETQDVKGNFAFNLLSFFSSDYYNIVQLIVYGSLILIIASLLINILVRFDIQYKDLIFKALGFTALLILFILLDKGAVTQLIPHNFSIY
jgi:hypothetical protein